MTKQEPKTMKPKLEDDEAEAIDDEAEGADKAKAEASGSRS